MKSIFVWLEFRTREPEQFKPVFEFSEFGPDHEHFKTGAAFVQAIRDAHRKSGFEMRILNIVIEG